MTEESWQCARCTFTVQASPSMLAAAIAMHENSHGDDDDWRARLPADT